jgi:secreted trypsin-like serine protease
MRFRTTLAAAAILFPGAGGAQTPSQDQAGSRAVPAVSDDPSPEFDEAVRRYRDRVEEKIVGGVPAADHEFPWQVSLGVAWIADAGAAHYCGGTIYSARWILTAGHCVGGKTADQIAVAYGSNTLGTGVSRVNVVEIVRHRGYRWHPDHIENDVALLRLRDPIKLGVDAQALPLLTNAEAAGLVHNATELVVTGWGRTSMAGTNVSQLRKVGVKFMDRGHCSNPLSYGTLIKDGMLCAGVDAGGRDACKGDSGGPLVWRRSDGTVRLTGVVSFGEGCAVALKWGVYASAGYYRDWVVQNAP